jgi:carbon-monoxide dehydrogenase large subunit
MTFFRPDTLGPFPRIAEQMLKGEGVYVDDLHIAREAHGYVLRSPHPHARIVSIAEDAARKAPGVLAVLTGTDIADMARPLPCVIPLTSFGGKQRAEADRAILAVDRVRHVGDGVAFVIAETLEQARDAADLIRVEYDLLPVCSDTSQSVSEPIWPDAPNNLCFDWRYGDAEATKALFAQAAHVVTIELTIPRIVVNPLETRGAIGAHDAVTDRFKLITNTQGTHFVRGVLAQALEISPEMLRVVTPNVGGAFGSKIYAYPEHALVLLGAQTVGRPVRWIASRREAYLSDTQGRGHRTVASIALDADYRFLALAVKPTVDLGAYLSQLTPLTATGVGAPVQGGAYRFKAISIEVRGVFTNKVPADAFRGAGRPEATYVLERLIDRAARELGIDPAELRARNLPDARTDDLTTVTGLVAAGGRFLDNQHRCLEVADRDGFPKRRRESEQRGKIRGFGFAHYLEANGGLQVSDAIRAGSCPVESAALKFGTDGSLDIVIGTQSSGQDHATPMRLYSGQELGLEASRIVVREGDSDALTMGSGTGGSKSTLTSSVALHQAIHDVVSKGRALLAREWKIAQDDIRFNLGTFSATGSNEVTTIAELAKRLPGTLDTQSHAELRHGSNANGCHACEVEIDPDTGRIEVARYTAVDDFGTVIDAGAVIGQVHGGVAQGVGQVLMEAAPLPDILSRTFVISPSDYALPRGADVPPVTWIDNGLPFRDNVLGAKACGESGVAAAPPTVMNAIADALARWPQARDLQMPVRPADVWRAVRENKPMHVDHQVQRDYSLRK